MFDNELSGKGAVFFQKHKLFYTTLSGTGGTWTYSKTVVVGGGMVLLLYKYIGLTGAAYVAIPCVAPIALGGFYSYNGKSFYEYMGKKLHFMFGNKALPYVSTEGEPAIKAYEFEMNNTGKKKKMRIILFGMIAVIIAAAAGLAIFKATR